MMAVLVVVVAGVVGVRSCGADGGGTGTTPGAAPGMRGAPHAAGSRAAATPNGPPIDDATGCRIAGRVFLDGDEVEAQVALAGELTDAGIGSVRRAAAGADGSFDLGRHPSAIYRLLASTPGAEPQAVAVDCERGDADVEVFLSRCRSFVGGEVRDASGGGIAGARVSRDGFPLATTDEAGRYELCLGADGATLVAHADGYADAGRTVNRLEGVVLDFELVPEAVVVVRVVDGAGAAVADAIVRATPAFAAVEGGPQPVLGVTGADGSVELRGLAPSTYDVSATSAHEISARVPYDAAPGETGEVTLALGATASIRGRVTEAGAPVAGVRVRWIVDEQERGQAVSAVDGAFVIDQLTPGPGDVAVDTPVELRSASRTIAEAPAGPPIALEIASPRRVRGRVVRAGTPVGGVTVKFLRMHGTKATTRSDGRFELAYRAQDATGAEVWLEANSPSHGAFGQVAVKLGDRDVEGVEIELAWAGAISGIVVDEAGAPVSGAAVRMNCDPQHDAGTDVTARDGTFTARSLRGGGSYEATVRLDDTALPPAGAWPIVELAEGASRDGVRLVARVVRHEVAGVVVDASGAPIADALVQIVPGVRETRTAVDGRFTVASLHDGPYRITARASRTRTASVTKVAAGTTDLRLVVSEPGAARFSCTAPVTGPMRIASLGSERHRPAACDRTVTPLPSGAYVVVGAGVIARFTVASGATTEVTITPAAQTAVDVDVVVPPGVQPTAPLTCQSTWAQAPTFGTPQIAQVVDGHARLLVYRGRNRIRCSAGPGLHGELRIVIGDDPVRFPITLVERTAPP
jgi:hypothetical protein